MSDIAYVYVAERLTNEEDLLLPYSVSPVTPATPLEPDAAKPGPAGPQSRTERTRKKLDLSQNKRGAFSQMLGTLTKAKKEDKQRNASEAVSILEPCCIRVPVCQLNADSDPFLSFIGPKACFVGEEITRQVSPRNYIR
jgi:hypothetical protein